MRKLLLPKLTISILGSAAGIAILLFLYAQFIEPRQLHCSNLTIASAKIHNPLSIVLVSDMHLRSDSTLPTKVLDKITALKPTYICLAGDLENHHTQDHRQALTFIKRCAAIAPVICIIGNSDMCEENRQCLYCSLVYRPATDSFPKTVSYLRNNGALFTNDNLQFYGFDEATRGGTGTFKLNAPDTTRFSILLVHNTLFMSDDILASYNLVFAGHTHGAQIAFLKPFLNLYASTIDPRYVHNKLPKHVITSTGIGLSFFPIRFLVPPTLYDIKLLPIVRRMAL